MQRRSLKSVAAVLSVFTAALTTVQAADPPPSFKEVYDLLRTNLVHADDAMLERAALDGLLRQLSPQAALVTNGQAAPKAEGPALSKVTVFDQNYGYLRVARVEAGLAGELQAALSGLAGTNKIKGWVLDLRFATGSDYQAAADAADQFVATERPLLDWGQGLAQSKTKENALKVPVTVLVNRQTTGAPEALAAVLRKTDVGLLLGTNTAGAAFITKDLPLKNGQRLRVATASVKLGDGEALPPQGVKPDIQVAVSPAEEKLYLDDPYRSSVKYSALVGSASGNTNLSTASTNKSHRRMNEAELVRMLREGENWEDEPRFGRAAEPAKPMVRDPVLARALDLLKGLAVVRRLR
ncbi:MAG: S41 family peptidase [Verrucomicrobia bacterium]|nr:S41 family peptidase [Verrucomicrobiota bacterium]